MQIRELDMKRIRKAAFLVAYLGILMGTAKCAMKGIKSNGR